MVRSPAISLWISRWIFRLPPSNSRRAILRRFAAPLWSAFNRRDWEVNTLLFDPDRYEFRPGDVTSFIPGGRDVYRGIDEYLEAMELWLEGWSSMRLYLEDLIEVERDRLLHVTRFIGAGRTSGVKVDQLNAAVFHLRDGRVVKHVTWWDVAAGFRSVGLTHHRSREGSTTRWRA